MDNFVCGFIRWLENTTKFENSVDKLARICYNRQALRKSALACEAHGYDVHGLSYFVKKFTTTLVPPIGRELFVGRQYYYAHNMEDAIFVAILRPAFFSYDWNGLLTELCFFKK